MPWWEHISYSDGVKAGREQDVCQENPRDSLLAAPSRGREHHFTQKTKEISLLQRVSNLLVDIPGDFLH